MKKISLPAITIIALIFTSCKKDYTCKCTGTLSPSGTYSSTQTIHDTKSKAKATCDKTIDPYAKNISCTLN